MISAKHDPHPAGVAIGAELLDAHALTSLLAPQLGAGFRVVAVTPVAHAPGKRWVAVCRTTDVGGDGADLIVKLYTDPARATRSHDVLEQLYARRTPRWSVPRPIAVLPAHGLSVHEAARGRSLDELAEPARTEALVASARWIATLHGMTFDFQRRVNMDSEIRKIDEWSDLVSAQQPAAAAIAAQLREWLVSRATTFESPSDTTIHRDFQYRHVLVEDGNATVIDLDEVRTGDPAFDVAHFGANLRLLAIREQLSDADAARLAAVFLIEYSAAAGDRAGRNYDFCYAYTCLKIAKQLVRGRGPAPVPEGEALARQVRLMLEEGLHWTRL
jgi:hypothetical protein